MSRIRTALFFFLATFVAFTSFSFSRNFTGHNLGGHILRAPDSLAFNVQPSTTLAGDTIDVFTVWVLDESGVLDTAATDSVEISFGNNPGGRGVLTGTLKVGAIAGIATFSDISINEGGIGYSLTASADGLMSTVSDAFDITTGTQLSIKTQPVLNTYLGSFLNQIEVEVLDAAGNLAVLASDMVTLSIRNNPNNGSLSGTTSTRASSGVAIFHTLLLDSLGNGYTLEVSAAGLVSDTTDAFNIIPAAGPPARYEFLVQPSNTPPSEVMSPNIQVRVLDSVGNWVLTDNEHIGLTIANNPGNGILSGTDNVILVGDEDYIPIPGAVTVTSVDGVSTFTNISIDSAGVGYTLMAQGAGSELTQVSDSFDILSLPVPTSLAFVQQPTVQHRVVLLIRLFPYKYWINMAVL